MSAKHRLPEQIAAVERLRDGVIAETWPENVGVDHVTAVLDTLKFVDKWDAVIRDAVSRRMQELTEMARLRYHPAVAATLEVFPEGRIDKVRELEPTDGT
jgi:hypothetical protein